MKFNFIKFMKPFLFCALAGFIIDIIFNIRFFSLLGMFIGAYIGTESKSEKLNKKR